MAAASSSGNGWPPWADRAIKYGGGGGAVAVLWFAFLSPMRDDFRDFRVEVRKGVNAVRLEVRELKNVVSVSLNQRITRNEARDEEIMRRLAVTEESIRDLQRQK